MAVSLNTILCGVIGVLALVLAVLLILLAVSMHREKSGRGPAGGDRTVQGGQDPTAPMNDRNWRAVILNEQDPDVRWDIQVTESILVGRGRDCEIRVDDMSVSRSQCRLEAREDGLYVVNDQDPTNRTKVNGDEVRTERRLEAGDRLKLGRVPLLLENLQRGDLPSS